MATKGREESKVGDYREGGEYIRLVTIGREDNKVGDYVEGGVVDCS